MSHLDKISESINRVQADNKLGQLIVYKDLYKYLIYVSTPDNIRNDCVNNQCKESEDENPQNNYLSYKNLIPFKKQNISVPFYFNTTQKEIDKDPNFNEWNYELEYKDMLLNSIWAITARYNNEDIYTWLQK
jgi:hypothetical protein